MTSSRARIPIPQAQLAEVCRRHRIRWLALFGSVLRDDFRADSDVDVLIEFEPGQRYTYFSMAQVAEDLSLVLGKPIDLHVRKSLHPFLRDKVLDQAETLYAGA